MGYIIFVNGKECGARDTVTYEDILRMAGQPVGASVMYLGKRHGDSQRSGILGSGHSVKVEEGMRFSVAVTGNA
jgi:hypothetical protein